MYKPSDCFFSIFCLFALLTVAIQAQTPEWKLTPNDVISQEVIDSVALSPDHTALAYIRWRPATSVSFFSRFRGDVWIRTISKSASDAVNITEGANTRGNTSYFTPIWSPDGSKLALLSFNEETGLHVGVWDKATGRLRDFAAGPARTTFPSWFDNERLIFTMPAPGSDTRSIASLASIATHAYQGAIAAKTGVRPTSTRLESGISVDLTKYPQERLVLMSMDGGLQTLVSGVQITDVSVSPDKRYVAFLKQTGRRPLENATILDNDYLGLGGYGDAFGLVIVDLKGHNIPFQTGTAQYIKPGTFRWGPDGRSFAFLGTVKNDPRTLHIFRGAIGEPVSEVSLGAGATAKTFIWSINGLLVRGDRSDIDKSHSGRSSDWWLIPVSGTSQVITKDLGVVPATLLPISGGRTLVGIADGDVWRFDFEKGSWTNVTINFNHSVDSIRRSDGDPSVLSTSRIERALISVRNGEVTDYFILDLSSSAALPLTRPSSQAQPIAYHSQSDMTVFLAAEDTGTYLTVDRQGSREQIEAINENIRQITPGQARPISYRGLDGQQLKGWLLLPPDYKEGRRYPLVTWVYAGNVYKHDALPSPAKINANTKVAFLSWQLFASRGYAVLATSMPLLPRGQAQDVFLELTKGVLPAVDKVVELGIADPKRLAVAGVSFGGFSVYGLIAQTNRFQSAIAISGPSDFVGAWGTFGHRYFGDTQRQRPPVPGLAIAEAHQLHMANPPWKDAARYTRNSPIFYADRVQTPLLIIHGDLDTTVPVQQAEEFFTAMFRQGKRARYIQYTGEGHSIESAANIRDMWIQFYAWLDESCDVSRDNIGNLIFDGEHVKSRKGAPALTAEDFARFNEIELKSRSSARSSK